MAIPTQCRPLGGQAWPVKPATDSFFGWVLLWLRDYHDSSTINNGGSCIKGSLNCKWRFKMKASDRSEAGRELRISKQIPESHVANTLEFFQDERLISGLPPNCQRKNFYSDLIRSILHVQRLGWGNLTCLLSVEPAVLVTNPNHDSFSLFFILHKLCLFDEKIWSKEMN